MLVIPAIDLKDGRCVRLRQGDMTAETVYSNDVPQFEQLRSKLLNTVNRVVTARTLEEFGPQEWRAFEAPRAEGTHFDAVGRALHAEPRLLEIHRQRLGHDIIVFHQDNAGAGVGVCHVSIGGACAPSRDPRLRPTADRSC